MSSTRVRRTTVALVLGLLTAGGLQAEPSRITPTEAFLRFAESLLPRSVRSLLPGGVSTPPSTRSERKCSGGIDPMGRPCGG